MTGTARRTCERCPCDISGRHRLARLCFDCLYRRKPLAERRGGCVKPRLDRRFGVWRCRTVGTRIAGFGYTAEEAFQEWGASFALAGSASA